jgi:hydrogenase nickel incorporation protein HypA/HybF
MVAMRGFILHELSVCQALLAQVARIAADRGANSVIRITVEVGPLCGVEPILLANAFGAARTGSCAADADLAIETPVVRVRCLGCEAESDVSPSRLVCAACGGYRTQLVRGNELRLCQVELARLDPPLAQSA